MFKIFFKAFFNPIVCAIVLLSYFGSVFATCTKNQVEEADSRWAKAIDSNQVQKVVNLYAPDAVLLATVENKPITTQEGRSAYFTQFFNTYKNAHVTYTGDKHIQVHNDSASSSGLYTFSGTKDGKAIEVPARYTFIYRATANGCELIKHHSSQLPM